MTDQEKTLDKANKTVRSAEAAIADTEEKLTATKVMYAALGMSQEEFLKWFEKDLTPAQLKIMADGLRATEQWLKDVFEAAENPDAHPMMQIDTKGLRMAAVKRKFV